ncbi:HEAT repeat domain-containing protein [Aggregicoccus sp. 17bor-14]|uniref:HEAT repeat domain-containing protein n=1 Tax=Myxococcaceae TaxID=31 RepID=UPI00129D19AF|nr:MULTISPECIES: HEAT repeat domain-containing protein [Myxococcaceae]MBF5043996.1 HEAT repeat domain-containing protein [Simulacricoccus sp. 17bor-14]MRI89747.1 HEAT repeat domain-containing protein [Aggregicoccus sp. 17bor-14]
MPSLPRSLLLLPLCLTAACFPRAYQRAAEQDTPQAYRDFLREHPKDPYTAAAEERLAELDFQEASRVHSVVSYKRFLEAHPDAAQARAAGALLEALRFNAVRESHEPQALRQFLREHPDGAHRAEAEALLAEAERAQAARSTDPAQLEAYLRASPDDPRREELEARLDGQRFEEARAGGASRLLAYLRDAPAGAHREEARVLLLEREVQGLLASGLLEEAEARVAASPLGPQLQGFAAQRERAQAERRALQTPQPLVRAAQAGHYLRSREDLERALQAPDPLDRWEAAQELGEHVTVRVLDPLLDAFRTARNPRVREAALASLRRVLAALPPPVADYELSVRMQALRERASSPEVYLALAVLLDLAGRLEEAATEYQRGYVTASPDPVVLHRWVDLRRERRQAYSSAVAARQLALWARGVAQDEPVSEEGGVPLAAARGLCAAAVEARFAEGAIAAARAQATEFPEDLDAFAREAADARRLAEARLADAELLLRTGRPDAPRCEDARVVERLRDAAAQREQALRRLPAQLPRLAPLLLQAARERDPAPEVRAAAAQQLAAMAPP